MTRPVRRRVLLGGAAAVPVVATLGGCRASSGTAPPGTPGSPGTPDTSADPEPGADPDVALVDRAVAHERRVLRRVERTLATVPDLAVPLAGTLAVHRAHLELLRDDVPAASLTPVPEAAAAALARLVRAERRLQQRHLRCAVEARSGLLARALASMAAAAAQQAAVLGALDPAVRRRADDEQGAGSPP